MPQEYQVAGKKRSGGLVQHRKIIVGVRGAPGLEHEDPVAKIDPRLVLDDPRRRDDLDLCHQFVAQHSSKGIEIELAASGECSREVLVADDHRAFESGVPEDVIGVGMGIDDVSNRLRRYRADGCKQAAPFAHAAAAVDHSHSVVADDESEVGDCALVLRCHHGNGAEVSIKTGRDLGYRQRIGCFSWPSSRHGSQERRHQGKARGDIPPMGRAARHPEHPPADANFRATSQCRNIGERSASGRRSVSDFQANLSSLISVAPSRARA